MKVLIVGPYASSFSYAKVNRGLLQGLRRQFPEVASYLWQNPDIISLDRTSTAEKLHADWGMPLDSLTNNTSDVDVTIYNHYPANSVDNYNLASLPGKLKLMYIFWEETYFPQEKVVEINQHVHGVIVGASFVREVLRANGVNVPIVVAPCGLDYGLLELKAQPFHFETNKKFIFFHVSTAKKRKGVDLLLAAYFQTFTANDDVCLVLKTSPGPDNVVNQWLNKLNSETENPPAVLHISDATLTEQQILNMTAAADCVVYPTRAEGFGLPIAEAMHIGTPVIVTGYSAHMDFCNDENTYLLDYQMAPAIDSEAANIGARWAEPDVEDLATKLKYLFANSSSDEVKSKIALAKQSVANLRWENTARFALTFAEQLLPTLSSKDKRMAVYAPVNIVDGIGEYTRDLFTPIQGSFAEFVYLTTPTSGEQVRPDASYVHRIAEPGAEAEHVQRWLKEHEFDALHIQHHPALLNLNELAKMIDLVTDSGLAVYLTPHSVHSAGADIVVLLPQLKRCQSIFLHRQDDFDYLTSKGLTNLELFQSPWELPRKLSRQRLRRQLQLESFSPVIVTHGLVTPHKGLLETAQAVAILKRDYPDILWIAANAVNLASSASTSTAAQLQELLQQGGIEENTALITDFIANPELIFALLQAADIGILPYTEVGESSSAATRKFLGAGVPTITSNIPVMTDFKDVTWQIASVEPATIAQAVVDLWQDQVKLAELAKYARLKSELLSFEVQAVTLLRSYSR